MTRRTLILPNKDVWTYCVGRSCVRLEAPDGEVFVVWCSDVKGVPPNAFERGQEKRTSDGMIYPHELSAFIERLTSQPDTVRLVNRRKVEHERTSRLEGYVDRRISDYPDEAV